MSPKDKRQLAHEHLEAAQHAVSDERLNDAVNALFYASEAAVVALANQHDIDTRQRHSLKANAAGKLYERGILEEDFRPLLLALNQARKDIWYEGEEPELGDGIEDMLAHVERLVDAAEDRG